MQNTQYSYQFFYCDYFYLCLIETLSLLKPVFVESKDEGDLNYISKIF